MRTNIKTKIITHIILILGSIVTVFPFVWMILTSLKTNSESVRVPPTIFPANPTFDAYKEVFQVIPFKHVLTNSFVSTIIIVLAQVLLCSMAAYAFARLKFPLKNFLFILILSVLMVPGQIFLIPQYLIVMKLGLLNSMGGLVLPNLFSAFGTFLMRQFFLTIPKELEEAARIDGCSRFRIYWNIMMPLVKPGTISLVIFTAKFAWNNFMWPMIVTTSPEKMTLPPALSTLQGVHVTKFPPQMAGATLAVLPILILYIVFQKQFIEGVAHAGVKG